MYVALLLLCAVDDGSGRCWLGISILNSSNGGLAEAVEYYDTSLLAGGRRRLIYGWVSRDFRFGGKKL